MDSIPPPYNQHIQVQDDQRLLGCWFGVPVLLNPDGSVQRWFWERTFRGYRREHEALLPKYGLLLLTDKGLVHCVERLRAGVRVIDQVEIVVDFRLRFDALVFVGLQSIPSLERPVLLVRLRQGAGAPGPTGPSPGALPEGELRLLMSEDVYLDGLVEQIRSAAREQGFANTSPPDPAAAPASSGYVAATPAPEPDDSDSPIHFHAENDSE